MLALASRRALQKLGYAVRGKHEVLVRYGQFRDSERWPYARLVEEQERQLSVFIRFVTEQSPYYEDLFRAQGLTVDDVRRISDLEKLPILTKRIIRANRTQIRPKNLSTQRYTSGSTGGSTGDPLKYLMSHADHARGVALLYRGWGYGGYRLGDRVAVVAGGSLIPSTRSAVRKRIQCLVLNTSFYSSYGMDEQGVLRYLKHMNRAKPRFLRGYASAIHHLARFIRLSGEKLSFRPEAVFTTSETLLPGQREAIEAAFGARVFDNYGLNDGGVSAYECSEHCGMHVDTERAILEVVDDEGRQIVGKPGRILATSLYNYAFPFIRYDTGDIGTIAEEPCRCGRQTPLLVNVLGRVTDVLEVNGRAIGSPVLTVLFGRCNVEQYQIVQESERRITCRIVRGEGYSEADERLIRESLASHIGEVEITFEYATTLTPIDGSKHRFVVNRASGTSKSV